MTRPGDEDLEQLRSIDRADVFKAGQHAATLTRTGAGVEFRLIKYRRGRLTSPPR